VTLIQILEISVYPIMDNEEYELVIEKGFKVKMAKAYQKVLDMI